MCRKTKEEERVWERREREKKFEEEKRRREEARKGIKRVSQAVSENSLLVWVPSWDAPSWQLLLCLLDTNLLEINKS